MKKLGTTLLVLMVCAFFIAIVVLAIVSGKAIRKQEALVAERNTTISTLTQRNAQQESLIASDQTLIEQKDSSIAKIVTLYANEQKRSARLEQRNTELARLNAQLAQDTLAKATAYARVSSDLNALVAKYDSLQKVHVELQSVSTARGQLIGEYIAYANSLQPYLTWLQNEAGRNWWEKLLDRDKLPKPSSPLPQPPAVEATN